MKKTITAFAIAAIFTACTSKPNPATDAASLMSADTISMNQNSLTEKTEDFNMNGVSDTIVSSDGSRYVKVDPNATVTKTVTTTRTTAAAPARKTTRTKTTSSKGSTGTSAGTSGTGTESRTGTGTTTPTVAKKKGWSNSAKGAVIGAGTGAAAGAIIGKNKVKGAIIGGVLGAGGGFVIGKAIDKKAEKNQ
ncbi:MAG: outer membrane protein [Segetibacter sp.]|nr:outer membrane protein [Segetibacter sp.]